MSDICWKCGDCKDDGSVLGLCDSCYESLFILCGVIVYLLVDILVYIFVMPVIEPGLDNMVSKFVISSLFTVLGAIFGAALGFILYKFLAWVLGWIVAFVRIITTRHKNRLHTEAVERAMLAEPQHLDGQQLDALLTEQYKEKMGWK